MVLVNFKFKLQKTKYLCSHCQERKTTHRCPICDEPTCSKCKIYNDFQIYIPKYIIVRTGTCKECKEELIDLQTIMVYKAVPQIVGQISEHIKRFLEKFGIEFN